MRCPKCGYISFDYNQLCPKCNKDISDEQAKLNLPTYKHNPPSLLGMLVGGGDESSAGFTLDNASTLQREGVDLEDSVSMTDSDAIDLSGEDNELEISLSDDLEEFDLPEIDLDEQSGDVSDIELDSGGEELSLDMDEISFEDSNDAAAFPESDSGYELDLDLDKDTGEENEKYPTVELNVSDLKINETGELEISSLPDDIVTPGNIPEEDEIEIDQIDLSSVGDPEIDNNSTASLDLSDLTIDDSDELGEADTIERIGSENKNTDIEDALDLGDLVLEEDDTSLKDDESLVLPDLMSEDTEKPGDEDDMTAETVSFGGIGTDDEGSIGLDDLALEDDDSSLKAEESLDLADDLSFDDMDVAIDLDNEETGEIQLTDTLAKDSFKKPASDDDLPFLEMDDLEKSISDDTDDELTLDLENLDLELDLEDSEDKK